MYAYGWFVLLYGRNWCHIVKQLQSNKNQLLKTKMKMTGCRRILGSVLSSDFVPAPSSESLDPGKESTFSDHFRCSPSYFRGPRIKIKGPGPLPPAVSTPIQWLHPGRGEASEETAEETEIPRD